MAKTDVLSLLVVFAAGILLGTVFFGGLWWTIRRGLASPHPAWWFAGGFIVRMAFLLAALYYLSGEAWIRLILLGAGILLGRGLILRLTKSSGKKDPPEQEVLHASQP